MSSINQRFQHQARRVTQRPHRSSSVYKQRDYHRSDTAFGSFARVALLVSAFSTVVVAADFGSWPLILASLLLSTAAALYVSISLKLSLLELTVIAIPITFYPPLAIRVNGSLADLLLPALLLSAFFTKIVSRKHSNSTLVVVLYALAIQATGLLSLIVAANSFPLFSLSVGIIATVKLALVCAYFLALYILARHEFGVGNYRVIDIWGMTAAASATIGIIAIVLRVASVDIGLTYAYRATGTFQDPNAFGAYLLLSAGIIMWAKFKNTGSALSVQLIPLALAIVLTGSRGVIVSVIVALFLTISTTFIRRSAAPLIRAVVAITVLIFAVVALLPRSVTSDPINRATSVFSSTEGSSDVRFGLWQTAIDLWNSSPLFGIGLGHFRLVTAGANDVSLVTLAHNTYLSFLAETGLIGFLAIISFPGILLIRLLFNANDARSLFMLFSLVAVLVLAFTLNLENFRPLWAFMAICLAFLDLSKKESKSQETLVERSISKATS